jgi:SulP family sulfate permease
MPPYKFNRLEFAGSLGDLGTLLPIAIGMILINGLNPMGVLLAIGLFYILSGAYYGVTVPVQPMKVIGAYAIATAVSVEVIAASTVLIGVLLLVIALTGAMTLIGKYTPKATVRGVQLTTGVLLMAQGVRFMVGTSQFQVIRQAAEPYLSIQSLGPIPIGIIIGVAGGIATLFFLENRRFPAGLLVVFGGMLLGLIFGTREGFGAMRIGFNLPSLLPFGFPSQADFSLALLVLVLPQVPMTLGNAVIANADLSKDYFGLDSQKVTYRALCISMGLANLFTFLIGGMPLCHGAGGLAAHYRFGARTAGSNMMIGVIFVVLAILLGSHALAVINLLPMSILGVLLIFAGGQLALTLLDVRNRKDLFVAITILGITLASNLAYGFVVGIFLAYTLKSGRLKI